MRRTSVIDEGQRCAEQGHYWENCLDMFLRFYQGCKYCPAWRIPNDTTGETFDEDQIQ